MFNSILYISCQSYICVIFIYKYTNNFYSCKIFCKFFLRSNHILSFTHCKIEISPQLLIFKLDVECAFLEATETEELAFMPRVVTYFDFLHGSSKRYALQLLFSVLPATIDVVEHLFKRIPCDITHHVVNWFQILFF